MLRNVGKEKAAVKQDRASRTAAILKTKKSMEVICAHVANGGSLIGLCETWQVRYSDIVTWIKQDKKRKEAYDLALEAGSEWADDMILNEIRLLCRFDIRKLYDDFGALLPIHLLDEETARMVQTTEVDELFEGVGNLRHRVGQSTKVKVYDKLKALELAARNRQLLTDKVNHSGSVKLEDILAKSNEEPAA